MVVHGGIIMARKRKPRSPSQLTKKELVDLVWTLANNIIPEAAVWEQLESEGIYVFGVPRGVE